MYNRKKRTGIMLAYPFDEARLAKWELPCIVQPKLDGVRMRTTRHEMLSSTERLMFPGLFQDIRREANHIFQRIPGLQELDGELYIHGWSFERINSIASRTAVFTGSINVLEYHLFDVISNPPDEPQYTRTLKLDGIYAELSSNSRIKIVPSYICNSFDDVMDKYFAIIADGYEGIIIRNINNTYVRKRSTLMMKFKPKKHDIYSIIGTVEEVDINDNPKNSLGSLVCISEGQTFSVGTGFTRQQRVDLWLIRDELPGRNVKISYQHITPGRKVPRFPVFTEIL